MLSLADIKPPSYMDGKAFLGSYMRSTEPEYIFAAADRFDAVYDRNRAVKDKLYKYIKYYYPDKPMFLQVAYRDQQPIMQELYRLRDSDQLTPIQELWFREAKPKEELFDTWNDPHEINNLAKDPQYIDTLKELRDACQDWVESINDTGLIPESELIKRFWPDGHQPQTTEPIIVIKGNNISITCGTDGASIGYRIRQSPIEIEDQPWMIYNQAISLTEGQVLQVIAHRLGFLPSQIITHSLGK